MLSSAYKIYAEVLRNRLEKKTEDRNLLPENQCGFRKERSNLENVFILSHLVQREKKKKEDKVYAVFIDLKTAFDKVDREILWRTLEGKRIDKEVIWKIKKIYEGTEATIRTEDGFSKAFSSKKAVRQGCVLSPILFNMYVAGINNCMRKRGIGGIKLGQKRVWSLAYASLFGRLSIISKE